MTTNDRAWPNYRLYLYDRAQRRCLARGVRETFKDWGLPEKDQATLLGLPGPDSAVLESIGPRKFIADIPEVLERARLIIAIQRQAKFFISNRREKRLNWLYTPNKDFNNLSPIEYMLTSGVPGLRKLSEYLLFVE